MEIAFATDLAGFLLAGYCLIPLKVSEISRYPRRLARITERPIIGLLHVI